MSRCITAVFIASAFLAGSILSKTDFSKYKKVEAYQIRPGVLMMPRYTANGEVCEIGLQRQVYSPEVVRLYPSLSQDEIDSAVDELAPSGERGQRSEIFGGRDIILEDGAGITTTQDYENLTVYTLAPVFRGHCTKNEICTEGNIAIVIKWKNRKCV